MGASKRLAVAVVAVSTLALAGCSGNEASPAPSVTTTTASPSPLTSTATPTSTATSTAAPGTGSASPGTSPSAEVPAGFTLEGRTSPTFPKLGGDLGGLGLVRVGHHAGYDRVVWEFPGRGRPTYKVHYVDEPVGDPSGDPVPVKGKAYVEVLVTFVGIPADGTARPRSAPGSTLTGTVIAQADAVYGGFEGYAQTFIGVRDRQRPLRVTTLTDPTRLVVDVLNG